jgi:hypothetical protein
MHARLQEVEGQLPPLTEEANQLRQEREQTALALRAAQYQLQDSSGELARLRGEVTRLRTEAQELARGKAPLAANPPRSPAATDAPPSEPVPAELAARVSLLQQNLQQRPERQIPELQFADEKDWLDAAKLVQTDSDVDVRKGLSLLRTLAKYKFGRLLSPALLKFTEANNGDLPTDALQLKPFLTVPVDDAMLQRYELIATGNTSTPGFDPRKPVVRDKTEARIDPIYDASLMVSVNGIGGGGGPNTIFPNRGSSATSGIITTKVVENTMYEGPGQPAAKSDGMSAPKL